VRAAQHTSAAAPHTHTHAHAATSCTPCCVLQRRQSARVRVIHAQRVVLAQQRPQLAHAPLARGAAQAAHALRCTLRLAPSVAAAPSSSFTAAAAAAAAVAAGRLRRGPRARVVASGAGIVARRHALGRAGHARTLAARRGMRRAAHAAPRRTRLHLSASGRRPDVREAVGRKEGKGSGGGEFWRRDCLVGRHTCSHALADTGRCSCCSVYNTHARLRCFACAVLCVPEATGAFTRLAAAP
jgi:hypothetical protein